MLIKTTSLIAALLLAIAVAACGDDDGGGTATAAGSAELTGSFTVVSDAPEGSEDISGSVEQLRSDGGTATTIELSGLDPDADYIAHVHAGGCDQPDPGGPHYKFDLDGGDMPPNEIHLAFSSDDEGNGEVTVENEMRIPDGEGPSVVVHQDDEAHSDMEEMEETDTEDSEMGHSEMDDSDKQGANGGHGKKGDGHSHSHSDKLACADLAEV